MRGTCSLRTWLLPATASATGATDGEKAATVEIVGKTIEPAAALRGALLVSALADEEGAEKLLGAELDTGVEVGVLEAAEE